MINSNTVKTITVSLKSFNDELKFANVSTHLNCKVQCIQDDWIVNGKSTLGLMSLDRTKPIDVRLYDCTDQEIAEYNEWIVR